MASQYTTQQLLAYVRTQVTSVYLMRHLKAGLTTLHDHFRATVPELKALRGLSGANKALLIAALLRDLEVRTTDARRGMRARARGRACDSAHNVRASCVRAFE